MPKKKDAAKAGSNAKSRAAADALRASKARAKKLNQYYTKPGIVALCWKALVDYLGGNTGRWQFVDPSAGEGAFLCIMPAGTIAIDIDPKREGIVAGDFLKMQLPTDRPLVITGNPPFGKNASMAVAFFSTLPSRAT